MHFNHVFQKQDNSKASKIEEGSKGITNIRPSQRRANTRGTTIGCSTRCHVVAS